MLNQVSTYRLNNKAQKQSFGNAENTNLAQTQMGQNAADEFIAGIEIENKKQREGNFISKYMWSSTASIVSAVPILGYMFGTLSRQIYLKKHNRGDEAKNLLKHLNRNLAIIIAGSIALFAGLQHYFNSRTDKNYKKLEQDFKQLNTDTNAQLDGVFRSGYLGAYCNLATQGIHINKNIMNDPLTRGSLKSTIKHELVHARQYAIVARSKDGIKKLNYASILNTVRIAQKDPGTIEDFKKIQNDIQNDKTGKYDNQTISISGSKYKFKEFIEAINILLENPNATYNDIPIFIDKEHYQKIVDEKGPLTPEEEKKADEYFKALSEYKAITIFNAFNPFGSYRNNILEKEAYEENPPWYKNLFGKKSAKD